MQDCNPRVAHLRFRFFGFEGKPPWHEMARVRELLYKQVRYGFTAKNGRLRGVLVICDFRNVIKARFDVPRVRQRRGRLSPPFVVPARSRPEAAGAFNPSWDSPATSGHNFPHPLFPTARSRVSLPFSFFPLSFTAFLWLSRRGTFRCSPSGSLRRCPRPTCGI